MQADYTGWETLSFSVDRDMDTGTITLTITTDDGAISIDAGQSEDDAASLRDNLKSASDEAGQIADNWQDIPEEDDGYVTEDYRSGYGVMLERTHHDTPWGARGYPSREIATYELAKLMGDSGVFFNSWIQRERGITDPISDDINALLDDEGKVKPLQGVRYECGDEVLIGGYDYPYVVDKDYGTLGVMLHISGDPSITEFESHENLKPYQEEDCDE